MPVLRLQVSMAADTALPRDRFVMTPHFDVGFDIADLTTSPDAQALCHDLAVALGNYLVPQDGREINVKAYDAQGTAPVYPIGDYTHAPATYPASGMLREVALCLSFYSGRNIKRYRGRLYIPLAAIGGGSAVTPRPAASTMTKAAQLAPILQNLGGTNVDWVVYSRADNVARPVTNWWVDDEWDIQRRRGLRGTTRQTGTTTEAGVP